MNRTRPRLAAYVVASSFVALPALAQSSGAGTPAARDTTPAGTAGAKPNAAAGSARLPLDQALSGEARGEYDAALVLYEDGDFASASLKFQRAHALSRDPRLLWNAAAAEKQLRRYARMYLLVSRYLKEGEGMLTPAEKADAGELLRTVEHFVAHLTVNVNEPGAEFFIDGASLATLPTNEPLIADMGSRKFQLKKAGFKEVVIEREVVGGKPLTLDVKLEPDLKLGTLRVTAGPKDTIRIDGRIVGTGEWQGTLAAGIHSLSVTGEGKSPYQTDVAIQSGQLTTHRVSLETTATSERAAFASWPWVAGGVALVTLLSVGAYFAFRPDDPPPASAATGTIAPGYWTLAY
jgi:hypothetical protein